MANQQTPKSRARRLIKNHIETPGHTLEQLFVEIAAEIAAAEQRTCVDFDYEEFRAELLMGSLKRKPAEDESPAG